MSQPKRYDYTRWQLAQGSSMSSVHPDRGDEDERRCVWVAEDDYIRLKEKNAALAAENERLRKAGDAMADDLECMSENDLCFNSLEDWNAAKKGRDAK